MVENVVPIEKPVGEDSSGDDGSVTMVCVISDFFNVVITCSSKKKLISLNIIFWNLIVNIIVE